MSNLINFAYDDDCKLPIRMICCQVSLILNLLQGIVHCGDDRGHHGHIKLLSLFGQ